MQEKDSNLASRVAVRATSSKAPPPSELKPAYPQTPGFLFCRSCQGLAETARVTAILSLQHPMQELSAPKEWAGFEYLCLVKKRSIGLLLLLEDRHEGVCAKVNLSIAI